MDQPWIVLAFICAFSLATGDAFAKKALRPDNELAIAWLKVALSMPGLLAYLLLSPLPSPDRTFLFAFCASLPLEILAAVLYIKALRISPLSISLPFQSLTPLFLVFFSTAFLHQGVSLPAAGGILLIAAGGYVLNLGSAKSGVLAPFRAITRERGAVYMILVALIYSVTSTLGKLAVDHSSPSFFAGTYYSAITVCMLPVVLIAGKHARPVAVLRSNVKNAALPALFQAVMAVTHYAALGTGNVAYVIAIKRSSLLIGSLYGFLVFRERHVPSRLAGALLMFAGFVLIVLFR
jgi:uncharacterized membrane protein